MSEAAAVRGTRYGVHCADALAVALFALAVLFVALTFGDYGISNDEEVQHIYGRLLLDFYLSGGSARAVFEYRNLYLYGGLFDLLAAALEGVLPLNVWDLRHLLSAVFGLAGLAGSVLLARRLGGPWMGVLSLLALGGSGAWTGAMFTHTKDVPFAAAMVWVLLFMVRLLPNLPRPARADVIGLGIALGLAFGLRVGAIFAIANLVACVLAASCLGAQGARARAAFFLHCGLALLPAIALAAALAMLLWPWVALAPGNLWVAMTAFSHFAFDLDTILAGKVMKVAEVPRTYLLAYLLVRLPEFVLAGVAAALFVAVREAPRWALQPSPRLLPWLAVAIAAFLPLLYTLLLAPPLYNGLRHFTFMLPPLAVVAGAGWLRAWRMAAVLPWGRGLAALAFATLLAVDFGALLRLHPYEYVYFNATVGGLRGAYAGWEQDYWASSVRAASALLNAELAREQAQQSGSPRRYAVAVCAEPTQAAAWLSPQLRVTDNWLEADFFVSPTQMACDTALAGKVIAEVKRDGVPLAVVRDRRSLRADERRPR